MYFEIAVKVESALEHQALNPENPFSNPCVVSLKLREFCSLHIASVQSAVKEYLAIDSGAYVNE